MVKIIGPAVKNVPWEERPAGSRDVVWRYSKNPIIARNQVPCANSIFNSAVIPYKNKFVGVFRIDNTSRQQRLHFGTSPDGIAWDLNNDPIQFAADSPGGARPIHGYDPRVCRIEDRYYITWCNGYHGPTIGVAVTEDFKTYRQLENAFLPHNRNGVLFPRKINGVYVMLSRPSDNRHTEFGDIFLSESPDLCYWGKHRFVMPARGGWQGLKIGAGPVPIETSEGWLLIYHGVILTCNGFIYSMGAALLDIDEPSKVLYRTAPYLLAPYTLYECVGDVPNVVFPGAAVCDADTGRLAIYYGAADTVVCIAYARMDELVDFIKANTMTSRW